MEAQRAFADVIGLRPDFKDAADRLASLIRNIRAEETVVVPAESPVAKMQEDGEGQRERERLETEQTEKQRAATEKRTNTLKKCLLVLAAAVIIGFFVVLNTGEFATPTFKEGDIYKVPPSSSLSSIAQQVYGDASLASGLFHFNKGKLPNWSSLDVNRSLPDGISLYIPTKYSATKWSEPTPTPTIQP